MARDHIRAISFSVTAISGIIVLRNPEKTRYRNVHLSAEGTPGTKWGQQPAALSTPGRLRARLPSYLISGSSLLPDPRCQANHGEVVRTVTCSPKSSPVEMRGGNVGFPESHALAPAPHAAPPDSGPHPPPKTPANPRSTPSIAPPDLAASSGHPPRRSPVAYGDTAPPLLSRPRSWRWTDSTNLCGQLLDRHACLRCQLAGHARLLHSWKRERPSCGLLGS